MTKDTSFITVPRQLFWYLTEYKEKNKKGMMKYYLVRINGKAVGYGLINRNTKWDWLTVAVLPKYRRIGVASLLVKLMVKNSRYPLLEVDKDNWKALDVYKKLGFKKVSTKEGMVYMRYGR